MTCNCLTHVQVFNYDRRLTPSHPDPVEPGKKAFRNLKSMFQAAIVHKEDHFQLQWAMKVLHNKSDEELAALAFRVFGCQFGIIHVLRFKSSTEKVLKIGTSKYPAVFGRATRLKEQKENWLPCSFEKTEIKAH